MATLRNEGAAVIVSGATLTVGDSIVSGGTTTIGGPPAIRAPRSMALAAAEPIASRYVTNSMSVSDGSIVVNPSGSLEIGTGGLTFSGAANPKITVLSDSVKPGKVVPAAM